MSNEGRLLGKKLLRADGIIASDVTAPAFVNEGGVWQAEGGIQVGLSGAKMSVVASTLASVDFTAIQPAGSSGAQLVNVAMPGVAIGDQILAAPVGSFPSNIIWAAACFTANAVQLRAINTASGNVDPASTNFRITAIRFD